MGTVQNAAASGVLTPRQFADKFNINVQNVYYWCKQNEIGYKEGKFYFLTPEDQKTLLEMQKNRNPNKQYAKDPHSRRQRKRSTESVDSIKAKLELDDIETARMISMFLTQKYNEKLVKLIAQLANFKEDYQDTFTHDKVLLMVAYLIGLKDIRSIVVSDGYPFFKFIDPKGKDDYTVVYNIRNQVYYLDSPYAIVEQNPDLKIVGVELSLQS